MDQQSEYKVLGDDPLYRMRVSRPGGISDFLATPRGQALLQQYNSYEGLARAGGPHTYTEIRLKALGLILLDLFGDRQRQPDGSPAPAGGENK
jgi:hypothetical protein